MKTYYKLNKSIVFQIAKWFSGVLIVFCSLKLDEPLMYKCREQAAFILLAVSLVFIALQYQQHKQSSGCFFKRCAQGLFSMLILFALGVMLYDTAVFQYKKKFVLNTPVELLSRLGRHCIVGYMAPEEITALLKKRAIGGVYVTARNISNKTIDQVRQELKMFQALAVENGAASLFVAADQEGGGVSRLSPLLSRMPALSSLVDSVSGDKPIEDFVAAYAAIQAGQLADLGVNLNLSPVVDLKTDHLNHKLNMHSRIDQRAISADIYEVTSVASAFCSASLAHGVRATLKHFPGLGSVTEETHFFPGTLEGSREYLEKNDWYPFRQISSSADPFIMLGHVCVPSVDPVLPASLSYALVTGIIRNEWKFNGVLITDDFNMGAISGRKEGIGKSAVRSLNAGADLILLSYDGSQYYNVMYEMIKAYEKGLLNHAVLEKSNRRLMLFSP